MENFFKVVAQSPCVQVPNKEGTGQTAKCTIVLQAFGGKWENMYACTLFGNAATCKWYTGELVFASLRFQAREYNGQWYQDVVVSDIVNAVK